MKFPMFLDSGAFGLYAAHVVRKGQQGIGRGSKKTTYAWYRTPEFRQYVADYAAFIKAHADAITVYANVDVLFNPDLTWEIQQFLEQEHGLSPLPVVHFGTDYKWIEMYLTKGYKYIALGGLGVRVGQGTYMRWADGAFDIICNQPSRLPLVKVHGFAITAPVVVARYPWYSVDSARWIRTAAYGLVIYPRRKGGVWIYDKAPHQARVSIRTSWRFNKLGMVHTHKSEEKRIFFDYIKEKGFELGRSEIVEGEEVVVEPGLCNDGKQRLVLNAIYFRDLSAHLPEWPWPFIKRRYKGLGL